MIPAVVKAPLRYLMDRIYDWKTVRYFQKAGAYNLTASLDDFDFEAFKVKTIGFLESMRIADGDFRFRYSASCKQPTLYASVYACMTYSLLGGLRIHSTAEKNAWGRYFDSFQRPDDGLFYDPVVMNDLYNDSDWWGARHIGLHMITAYTDLGLKPGYPFSFLSKYYRPVDIKNWLDQYDWDSALIGKTDIDNKIMNIGCLLQYQRDQWGDAEAEQAVDYLKKYLLSKLSAESGFWGGFNRRDPSQRLRMVQFAYHLFPLFFYDGYFDFDNDRIAQSVLQTQNRIGGYGVKLNSSACEDIDSIDLLIRMLPFVSSDRSIEVVSSLQEAFRWVSLNQVGDGGFVFRMNESFEYGGKETSSLANKGGMLPTWFRSLSVAYMINVLGKYGYFTVTRCPGYEF